MDGDQNSGGESTGQEAELSLREEIEKNVAEIHTRDSQTDTSADASTTTPVEKTETTQAVSTDAAEASTTQTTAAPDPKTQAQTTDSAPTAPQSWNATEKALWSKVPPEVQAVIARREQDIHRAVTAMGEDAALGRKINQIATPYLPILRAEGSNPELAFQSLMQTAYVLRTAQPQQKVALFTQLAKQFGVDPSSLAAGSTQQVDPAISALQAEVTNLRTERQREQEQQHQHVVGQLQAQINAFAADPKNEFFAQVKPVMSALLGAGQATDLQDAYDKACNADPTVRSTIQVRQQAEAEAKRAAEARAKADAKRRAGSSISGSPGNSAQTTTAKSDLSLRDELKANLRAAMNS